MEIREYKGEDPEKLFSLAHRAYRAEADRHPALPWKSGAEFREYFACRIARLRCLTAEEDGGIAGFLAWDARDGVCSIPSAGYGAEGERAGVLSRLFQRAAEQAVAEDATRFAFHPFAGDFEAQRLFSMMQFGFMTETTARRIAPIAGESEIPVRALQHGELEERWGEIWSLTANLVDHLRQSPVFYPGREFTEEVYRAFYSEPGTQLFVAEQGGKLIGLIESNSERLSLLCEDIPACNVGEAYVLPEYRGRETAQALLRRAEEDLISRGIRYDWVEHGTANPSARGFWNKYFETISYQMTRDIRP